MSYPLDNAIYQWQEGHSRLQELAAQPALYRRVHRGVDAVREELRRRVGPTFVSAELADFYGRGTDWCLEVASQVAPEESTDWDPQVIADAAFYLFLRGARDWAGGRRIAVD
ncbi:MAG: hypothetical protein ACXWW8_03620 [Solirubrobacterales bacterium]